MNQHTAAIIIVSEDILLGKTDSNEYKTLLLATLTPKWNVMKLIVVPPNSQLIRYEVKMAFKMCEIVIVVQEVDNVDVCNVISSLFHEKVQSFSAICDVESKVNTPFKLISDGKDVSVIGFQRIFLLHGDVNSIVSAVSVLKLYLNDYRKQLKYRKKLELFLNENSHENVLNEPQMNGIDIKIDKEIERTVITAEATQLNSIISFEKQIIKEFGSPNVTHKADDLNIFDSYYFHVDPHVCQSIQIIEECFKLYDPSNVFISFNGGKDCTVLLHLTLAVLRKQYPAAKNPLCMYVRSEFSFPEQDAFIVDCQNYYNLEVIAINSHIKDGLKDILEKRPNLKACLMGTRRTDPFSDGLSAFQMTDPDWPQVVRVSPLLDWHYSYIWDYLLYFRVPYCSLYDDGYTSLGNMKNTLRNPSLLYYDVLQEKEVYLPAYKLMNAEEERNGRS